MRTNQLFMIASILSIFGCGPKSTTEKIPSGPFVIERITTKGKRWDMNYGRVNFTSVAYQIRHKGKLLDPGTGLETNTGVPGIWRIFELQGLPAHTLLFGSQSLYLLQEIDDKAVITPLRVQSSDFASIQWLDSEDGQPGIYREVYSTDEIDVDNVLSGGRYMAISHAAVLDIHDLQLYPFNLDNEEVDGYYVHQRAAIAFSPDSAQVVYCGYRRDAVDYMLDHLALVCYDYRKQTSYAVPFDRKVFHVENEERLTSEWVQDYFSWTPVAGGGYKLQLSATQPLPYKGQILYDRSKEYHYFLDIAPEPMMEALVTYLKETLAPDASQITRTVEQYDNKITIQYPNYQIIAEYGKYVSEIFLWQEGTGIPMEENKQLIRKLGQGFNTWLADHPEEVQAMSL